MATTLIVPGLDNSGPDHWQSGWQALEPESVRVEQESWTTPDLPRWAANVTAALDGESRPVWIVAHSFGCLAAVVAATRRPGAVRGAFLVAPADPQKFGVAHHLPQAALPFPSLLVASSTDPWIKLMTAALWAERWGSRLVNIGAAGHINAASGFGPWIEGRALFGRFCRSQQEWLHGDIGVDAGEVKSQFRLG
ncbi:MAG: alpha/beta hydrolase [Rhodocyclaceae bacterium]|nr:alpha/beta hydrolase [Rhodocyclaceae bacterium]